MAPALNEPLTQVQLPLSKSDSVGFPSPRPGLLPVNHHNIHITSNNHNPKLHSAKESSPTKTPLKPVHLQLPRISLCTTNGYAKPSFQLAFVQQITSTDGLAPPTGLSTVQHHMDYNISSTQQPTTNYHETTFAPPNDPVTTTSITPANTHTTIKNHQDQQNSPDKQIVPIDLDFSEANLDLEDVDESTNELINHTLRTPTSQIALDHHTSDSAHNNNTMGLQKDYLKDNQEMEQMLGDLANTSDLDLLQVFKSLAPSSSDNLCDLASGLALFNDVDVMNIGLEDVSTPIKEPDTQDIRNEIKKRHQQMMRKCDFLMRRLRKLQTSSMYEHISEEVYGLYDYSQKLIKVKERENKSISTMRQVSPLFPNNCSADQDISVLLGRLDSVANEQQCVLKKTGTKCSDNSAGLIASSSLAPSSRHKGGAINTTLNRLVPAFDTTFSNQLELAAGHLQTELQLVAEAIDSDATASSSGGESGDEFSAYTKQQVSQQQLQNPDVQMIENEKIWVFNGERMVRKYKTKKIKRQELERAKRAATRWARDRALIASRWSWLLAQISDLEYRIRQHSELHQQIKKNKGAVKFENSNPSTIANDNNAESIDTNTSNQSTNQSVNGYRGLLPGNTMVGHKTTSDIDDSCTSFSSTNFQTSSFTDFSGVGDTSVEGHPATDGGACRTRAFQRSEFRKRKLLQTTNLHTISKKAAKQSTVKCGCQWPLYPCALCTGRPDPTAPRDFPDMLAPSERVGLLDPGFHPVISFASDISHGISIEGMLRNTEFQTKAYRATSKAVIRGALALQKALKKDDKTNRKQSNAIVAGTKRKYNVSTNKFKKNLKNNNTPTSSKYKRNSSTVNFNNDGDASSASAHQYGEHLGHGSNGAMLPRTKKTSRSKNTSPTPTTSRRGLYVNNIERKPRSSYDIDNIVIPSCAATLPPPTWLDYKDIATPKWRSIENEDNTPLTVPTNYNSSEIVDDMEDVSPDAILHRHDSALNEERKKFSTFLKFPWCTRSRANRRTDSRAESSGTNTPDPSSPAAKPISCPTTPSATVTGKSLDTINEIPTGLNAKNERTLAGPSLNGTTNHAFAIRRRTTSKGNSISESLEQSDLIPPYNLRDFPLSEETFGNMMSMMPEDVITKFTTHQSEGDQAHFSKSNMGKSQNNEPETICKTDYDFENLIGASSLGGYPPFNLPDDGAHVLRDTDEETESVESGQLDEDPNDPEWFDEPTSRL